MNENFLQFYNCRLKRAIKSVQTWFRIIAVFVVWIFYSVSVSAYACNIGMFFAIDVLVDVILAFIAWVAKKYKIKSTSK